MFPMFPKAIKSIFNIFVFSPYIDKEKGMGRLIYKTCSLYFLLNMFATFILWSWIYTHRKEMEYSNIISFYCEKFFIFSYISALFALFYFVFVLSKKNEYGLSSFLPTEKAFFRAQYFYENKVSFLLPDNKYMRILFLYFSSMIGCLIFLYFCPAYSFSEMKNSYIIKIFFDPYVFSVGKSALISVIYIEFCSIFFFMFLYYLTIFIEILFRKKEILNRLEGKNHGSNFGI